MPRLHLALALWLALAPAAAAQAHEARYVVGPGSLVAYQVQVKTLVVVDERIVGVNDAVHGEVRWPQGGAPTGWAEADVSGFHSGNKTRDDHVRAILGAPATPRVRFQLDKLEGFSPTGAQAVAVGTLAANGHTHAVRVPIRYELAGETLRIEGEAPLRFQDYGIAPPVLGVFLKRAPEAFSMRVRLVATAAR